MRRLYWPTLFAALLVALVIGAWPQGRQVTPAQRLDRLAHEIRCPTCSGLSVAESDAPLAQSARDEVRRQVDAGATDSQVREFFVARYGKNALMSPPRHGFDFVTLALPIVAVALALTFVALAVWRWRARSVGAPTDEDRRLVDRALGSRP